MNNVLVINGHPDLSTSHANTLILAELADALGEDAIIHLAERYPDYRVDIAREQAALRKADIVVLLFPFYWYSVPAILKKWLDDVFAYGFAYGSTGDKLQGKTLLLSFTIGGPDDAYRALGYNHFSIEQLLRPMEQTAYLAGMDYRTVFTHGMVYIPDVYNTLDAVQQRARDHAGKLLETINELRATQQKAMAA